MSDGPSGVNLGIPGITDARPIAAGGAGIVYRARQPDLDRDVAVKVLRGGAISEVERSRFDRERRALGRLSGHPNIISIHLSGFTPAGEPYLVMPFIAGGSLADELEQNGPWTPEAARRDMVRITNAVEYAHSLGILHRDIKPANVLRGRTGEPLVADFGIARLADVSADLSQGMISATPAYAAPELFAGVQPSLASDVYSLGALHYALLAGHAPFADSASSGLMATIARIESEEPPALPLDESVSGPIMLALAKDPADRPPTAAAYAELLDDSSGLIPAAAVAAPPSAAPAANAVRAPVPTAPQTPAGIDATAGEPDGRVRPSAWAVAALLLALVGVGAILLLTRDREPDVVAAEPTPTEVVAPPPPTVTPTATPVPETPSPTAVAAPDRTVWPHGTGLDSVPLTGTDGELGDGCAPGVPQGDPLPDGFWLVKAEAAIGPTLSLDLVCAVVGEVAIDNYDRRTDPAAGGIGIVRYDGQTVVLNDSDGKFINPLAPDALVFDGIDSWLVANAFGTLLADTPPTATVLLWVRIAQGEVVAGTYQGEVALPLSASTLPRAFEVSGNLYRIGMPTNWAVELIDSDQGFGYQSIFHGPVGQRLLLDVTPADRLEGELDYLASAEAQRDAAGDRAFTEVEQLRLGDKDVAAFGFFLSNGHTATAYYFDLDGNGYGLVASRPGEEETAVDVAEAVISTLASS